MSDTNYREWSETVMDWITDQPVEIKFRTDGTRTWVWAPSGDGLELGEAHDWALVQPGTTSA